MEKLVKKKDMAFLDLSLACHIMGGIQLWINLQGFNLIPIYCILTKPGF